jgi:hypothetical protein
MDIMVTPYPSPLVSVFHAVLKLNTIVPVSPAGGPKMWGAWTAWSGFGNLLGATWGSYYLARGDGPGGVSSKFWQLYQPVGVFFDGIGNEDDEPLLLLGRFSVLSEALQLRGNFPTYVDFSEHRGHLNRPQFISPHVVHNVVWKIVADS